MLLLAVICLCCIVDFVCFVVVTFLGVLFLFVFALFVDDHCIALYV